MTFSMTFVQSAGFKRFCKVLADATQPMTARKLCEAAHISINTWQNHYRAHLVARKEIHVAGWERHQFGWAPQYAAGQGETPKKPKAAPPKVATAKWKERTGYVDPRYAHRRLARPRDKVLAALMGLRA